MKVRSLIWVVTVALLAGACAESARQGAVIDGLGPSADGGAPPADDGAAIVLPPASFTEFCRQFATAYCQGHMSCCADPSERHADRAACEQGYRGVCQAYFSSPVFGGCVPFDKAAAQAYLVELRVLAAGCVAKPLSPYVAFKGAVGPGGSCSYQRDDFFPRICCQPGTSCQATAVSGETVEASCGGTRQLGEACAGAGCADGLYCGRDEGSGAWLCAARKPNGQSCTYGSECLSIYCKSGACQALDVGDVYCGKAVSCFNVGWSISADYADCVMSYSCVGSARLTARCKKEPGGSYSCACERNAVQQKTFVSSSICTLNGESLRSALRTGCGWGEI